MFSSMWISEQYKNTMLAFKLKEVLFKEKSEYQLIEIVDTYDWGRLLMLDGCTMVSEKEEFFYHETISHLACSCLESPKRALVVGGGDGGTARELLKYSSFEEIYVVEIDEKVIKTCRKYMPFVGKSFDSPVVKIVARDAFEFLREHAQDNKNYFDLIICDGSDPVDFAEILIDQNFYKLVNNSLKANGVFITQSSSPIAQEEELKKTYKNLKSVFNNCRVAWSVVPIYPGAIWSYTLASQNNKLEKIQNISDIYKNIYSDCKFWNEKLFDAFLSEPNFIKNILQN